MERLNLLSGHGSVIEYPEFHVARKITEISDLQGHLMLVEALDLRIVMHAN